MKSLSVTLPALAEVDLEAWSLKGCYFLLMGNVMLIAKNLKYKLEPVLHVDGVLLLLVSVNCGEE